MWTRGFYAVAMMALILVLASCDQVHAIGEKIHLPNMPAMQSVAATDVEGTTITLLHTNDFHSQHDPLVVKGEPEQGGAARLMTLINQIRAEKGADHVLLLSGGDNFQGSLFYNVWKGSAEVLALNHWGYDAVCLGNHEFDLGSDELVRALAGGPVEVDHQLRKDVEPAKFLVLATNLDTSKHAKLDGLTKKTAIIERGGAKYGLLGVTTVDAKTISSPGENVSFMDYVTSVQQGVDELEKQGVNKIFLMSHTGYTEDARLIQQVRGVDVVVAGHDHALTGDPMTVRSMGLPNQATAVRGPYPTVVQGKDGVNVLVVSAYEKGRWLGQIDLTFDRHGHIQDGMWNAHPIFVRGCTGEGAARDCSQEVATPDLAFQKMLDEYYKPIAKFAEQVLGSAAVSFGGRGDARQGVASMGELTADIILDSARQSDQAQLAMLNRGGIRTSIDAGEVRFKHVNAVLPFPNTITVIELSGKELVQALDHGLTQAHGQSYGAFPQVAGVEVQYCAKLPCANTLLEGTVVTAVEVQGQPLDLQGHYRVATSDYQANGGDFYDVFKQACGKAGAYCRNTGVLLKDAVADWFRNHSPVQPFSTTPRLVAH